MNACRCMMACVHEMGTKKDRSGRSERGDLSRRGGGQQSCAWVPSRVTQCRATKSPGTNNLLLPFRRVTIRR